VQGAGLKPHTVRLESLTYVPLNQIENTKMLRAGQLLAIGLGCTLLSACEPLPVSVTIKAKPGAEKVATGSAAAAGPAGFGSLAGTVTYTGAPPARSPLVAKGDTAAKDPQVCAVVEVPDESLDVNSANKGLRNVVILLAKAPANVKPELAQAPTEPVVFDQKGCRFFPHVLPVRAGQKMLIKSNDPIAHNTHTFPSRNDAFNSTIAANDRDGVPCLYKKGEGAPVEVKCDLHTWMKAYHVPVDHPYFAVTDENGAFKIEGLPAGKHTFRVWQERGGFIENKLVVEIKPDAETKQDLSYGADKIAAVPQPTGRSVTLARLQQGGEVTFEK
jgi:hypothetical protein